MRDDRSTSHLARLLARLQSRHAVIGVIGLDHVGLPLSLRYASAGFHVLGIDTDANKVERLSRGDSTTRHIPSSAIAAARVHGIEATGDFSRLTHADAVIICVPTPLNAYREPDLSPVLGTLEAMLPHLRAGQIIALESAIPPGSTDEEIRPRLAARGFYPGQDMFLVFSPEREDRPNLEGDTRTLGQQCAKVCGADTQGCMTAGMALYSAIDSVVPVSSTRSAELINLFETIQRAVHIALVNELKIVAERMQVDIDEVLRAAHLKSSGLKPCEPGHGSHGIAAEPFLLAWKARQYGVHARFIELAAEINSEMPYWVIGKLTDALNERSRAVKGSRVLVLGIAADERADPRLTAGVQLLEILHHKGAIVAYSDPHVPVFSIMGDPHVELTSIELRPQSVASFDVVVVATSHDAFDYDMIGEHARLIVDTCGVYLTPMSKLVKA